MSEKKLPLRTDTPLLTFPITATSSAWTPEEGEREFRKLLLQGVQEVLDTNHRDAFQIVITVCYGAKSVKARLIPLASRLYPSGCHTCHEEITNPHPRELFYCQECGDRSERSRQLEKEIPKDHPREIPMYNALYRWKNERATCSITVRIRDEAGPVEKATEVEMKKLGIWPWGRGGAA